MFGVVCLLICFSLAAIYSIAISNDSPDFSNFRKQLLFGAFGVMLIFAISFFDYRLWRDLSYLIYGSVALLLAAVLFFGTTVSGTTGWFSILGFKFQPVEFAKIALIIFLAWFLSNQGLRIREFKIFLITAVITGVYFLLVMLQPDFGSAMILFFIWIMMIFFAGANKKHLFLIALAVIVAVLISWFFLFQNYQRDRIITFLNPQADPYDRGYQVRQAMIAVGAGQWFGRGLGFGSQSQLKFLPASQTDFIFAVIAEELGLLGVGLILFFWLIIFYRLIKAAKTVKDSFATIFILGVTVLFFVQLVINMGMNIGIVPVTGISLPFLSYGGSFLVTGLALIGIIESMIVKNKS